MNNYSRFHIAVYNKVNLIFLFLSIFSNNIYQLIQMSAQNYDAWEELKLKHVHLETPEGWNEWTGTELTEKQLTKEPTTQTPVKETQIKTETGTSCVCS